MRAAAVLTGLAAVFLTGWLGRAYFDEAPPGSGTVGRESESDAVSDAPRLRGSDRIDVIEPSVAASGAEPPPARSNGKKRGRRAEAALVEAPPGDGVQRTSLDEARALVRRVGALLGRGKPAHLELWRLLESVAADVDNEWFCGAGAGSAAARHIWQRFLMEHDEQVAAFLQAAFVRMAETQLDPTDVGMEGLEVIAPDGGAHLVALLPPVRLEALRTTLRRLVRNPELLAEDSRSSVRRKLSLVLAGWASSASPEQARRALKSGETTPEEALALLERLPRSEVAQHDPVDILCRLLVASQDWPAFRGNLWWIREAGEAISADALERLDAAVLAYTRTSGYTDHPQRLHRYLRATSRGGWPKAEAFVDAGLDAGGDALTHVPLLLTHLRPRPPAHVVRRVLERRTLPPHVRTALEALLKE